MLQIIEIQHIALLLGLAQRRHEIQGQRSEAPDGGATLCEHVKRLLLAVAEVVRAQCLDRVLQGLVPGIKALPEGRIVFLQELKGLGCSQLARLESHKSLRQPLPVLPCLKNLVHGGDSSLQHFSIGGKGRSHCLPVHSASFLQGALFQPVGEIIGLGQSGPPALLYPGPEFLSPGGFPDTFSRNDLISFCLLFEPGLRQGLALAEFIKAQNSLIDLIISVVIAIVIGKGQELLPLFLGRQICFLRLKTLPLRLMVVLLQQFLQHVPLHEHHFLLTGQAKLGIYVDSLDILADDALAEDMEGADGSPRQQDALPVQPAYFLRRLRF